MKDEPGDPKEKQPAAPIVIPDECGDSMWDAVLEQEVKACEVAKSIALCGNIENKIEAEQAVKNKK